MPRFISDEDLVRNLPAFNQRSIRTELIEESKHEEEIKQEDEKFDCLLPKNMEAHFASDNHVLNILPIGKAKDGQKLRQIEDLGLIELDTPRRRSHEDDLSRIQPMYRHFEDIQREHMQGQ